jgi:hypothetical protein
VGGQLHSSAALPLEKSPRYPWDRRLGGPYSRSARHREEKILDPTGTRTPTPRSSIFCIGYFIQFHSHNICIMIRFLHYDMFRPLFLAIMKQSLTTVSVMPPPRAHTIKMQIRPPHERRKYADVRRENVVLPCSTRKRSLHRSHDSTSK